MNSTADFSKSIIIPLARIVREHGFERSGVLTFKADLFSRGASLFKDRLELWVARDPSPQAANKAPKNSNPTSLNSLPWKSLKLAAVSSPHGGAWPQASGVLLRVPKVAGVQRGDIIGIARSDFPELSSGYYVCDLIGKNIEDEKGALRGSIIGFQDLAPNMNIAVVNLVAKTYDGKMEFAFPSQWIVGAGTSPDSLKVEGLEEWMLSGREPSDEATEKTTEKMTDEFSDEGPSEGGYE